MKSKQRLERKKEQIKRQENEKRRHHLDGLQRDTHKNAGPGHFNFFDIFKW